jgi:AcrR family transcriptional regulator
LAKRYLRVPICAIVSSRVPHIEAWTADPDEISKGNDRSMSASRRAKIEQQHLRLLDGLAASIREKGLPLTQVSDIVRHARTSRRTFYNHFPDKDSCLVELVHLSAAVIMRTVSASIDLEAPRGVQVDQAIDSYVSVLVSEPRLTLTLSSPSVSERVVQAQRDGLEQFAAFLASLTLAGPAGAPQISLECAYMLVSGLRAMLLRAVERGDDLDRAGNEGKAVFKALLDASVPKPGVSSPPVLSG